jgi:hypothetical protein
MRFTRCPRKGMALALALTAGVLSTASAPSPQTKPPACSAPQYHQFDFWLGDWDAFEPGATKPDARVRVTSILCGCVVYENYEQPDGAKGESFSIYDASRELWHQTWVTNRGKLLVIQGEFTGGKMVMSGVDHFRDNILVRGTWIPARDGVRETAVLSSDGGKTWKLWFDLYFRHRTRRSANSRPALEAPFASRMSYR